MLNDVCVVFLITRGLNGKEKAQQVFLEKDISRAKLYFEAYILENENANDYKLYRLGHLDKRKRITEDYCFITGGYEIRAIKENRKKIINQIRLDIEVEQNARKYKNNAEIVKELFVGQYV